MTAHSAATIEVLPAIADAIQERVPILLDRGVRRVLDVLKAIAYGSASRPSSVVGDWLRPTALDLLRQEFDPAMALACRANLKAITRDLVMHGEMAASSNL